MAGFKDTYPTPQDPTDIDPNSQSIHRVFDAITSLESRLRQRGEAENPQRVAASKQLTDGIGLMRDIVGIYHPETPKDLFVAISHAVVSLHREAAEDLPTYAGSPLPTSEGHGFSSIGRLGAGIKALELTEATALNPANVPELNLDNQPALDATLNALTATPAQALSPARLWQLQQMPQPQL
jgi:hypothetical protein